MERERERERERESYQLNTKQPGEALELLTSLPVNSVNLAFFDPQYEKVQKVLKQIIL